jgi:hypothetical protein
MHLKFGFTHEREYATAPMDACMMRPLVGWQCVSKRGWWQAPNRAKDNCLMLFLVLKKSEIGMLSKESRQSVSVKKLPHQSAFAI